MVDNDKRVLLFVGRRGSALREAVVKALQRNDCMSPLAAKVMLEDNQSTHMATIGLVDEFKRVKVVQVVAEVLNRVAMERVESGDVRGLEFWAGALQDCADFAASAVSVYRSGPAC